MSIRSARFTSRIFPALLLLLLAPNLYAADTIASSLKTTLLGKRFFLRNFSAEKKQKFVWKDDHLEETTTASVHALIAFVPSQISGNNRKVSMQGNCFISIIDNQKHAIILTKYLEDVSLQIDVQKSHTPPTERAIEDSLFFPDLKSAVTAVPPGWKALVPFSKESLKTTHLWLMETVGGLEVRSARCKRCPGASGPEPRGATLCRRLKRTLRTDSCASTIFRLRTSSTWSGGQPD